MTLRITPLSKSSIFTFRQEGRFRCFPGETRVTAVPALTSLASFRILWMKDSENPQADAARFVGWFKANADSLARSSLSKNRTHNFSRFTMDSFSPSREHKVNHLTRHDI